MDQSFSPLFNDNTSPDVIHCRAHDACVAFEMDSLYRWLQLAKSLNPCPPHMELCVSIAHRQRSLSDIECLLQSSSRSLETSVLACLLFSEFETLQIILPLVSDTVILTNALIFGIKDHHFMMSNMLAEHPATDIHMAVKHWLSGIESDTAHLPNTIGSAMIAKSALCRLHASEIQQLIDQAPGAIKTSWENDASVRAIFLQSVLTSECPPNDQSIRPTLKM